MVALLHRDLTGEGQFVDVSAVDVLSSMIGDRLLEYSVTGRELEPDGNRHPNMAPHGCYPCSGDDWISIAVADDAEWRRLCDLLDAPGLADDGRYLTTADRQRNEDALDDDIGRLTAGHGAEQLTQRLRCGGVAASKSATAIDVISDPLLWEREFYRFVSDHREGQRPVLGPPWRTARASAQIIRGAPDLGEHNDYVLNEILSATAGSGRSVQPT